MRASLALVLFLGTISAAYGAYQIIAPTEISTCAASSECPVPMARLPAVRAAQASFELADPHMH